MAPRLSKGKRVQTVKDVPTRFGNVVEGLGQGVWIVAWDGVPEKETRAKGSIKLVPLTAALSPETSKDVRRATAGENDDENEEDPDDESASSGEESDCSSEQYDDPNPHNQKRARWSAHSAKLVGNKVKVTNSGQTVEWTVIDSSAPGSMVDQFPDVPGRLGSRSKQPTQMKVLRDFSFDTSDDSILRCFLHLWPGDFEADCAKVRAKWTEVFPRDKHIPSDSEIMVAIGIMVGAIQFAEQGRGLFRDTNRPRLSGAPNMKRFMAENRFENLKRVLPWVFADSTGSPLGDPWYRARGGINGFNENRARTILKSNVMVPDESMIAWEPQTTKTGGLPNISYIKRKPKPLGTELKDVADGRSGLLVWLEIQEGKTRMGGKPYVKALGANAACAMRAALGALQGPS